MGAGIVTRPPVWANMLNLKFLSPLPQGVLEALARIFHAFRREAAKSFRGKACEVRDRSRVGYTLRIADRNTGAATEGLATQ